MLDHSYRVLLDLEKGQGMPTTTTHRTNRRKGGDAVQLAAKAASNKFSGDYIWKATPVPIPNTAVKLPEPMVVPKA